MTLKIAVLAPMPSAIVNAAVNVKMGLRRRVLAANARSRSISDASSGGRLAAVGYLTPNRSRQSGRPFGGVADRLSQLLAVRRRRSVVASFGEYSPLRPHPDVLLQSLGTRLASIDVAV